MKCNLLVKIFVWDRADSIDQVQIIMKDNNEESRTIEKVKKKAPKKRQVLKERNNEMCS